MQPVEYSKAKLYKGAAFTFSFRLSRDGRYIDPENVIFTLSKRAGGEEVYEKQYTDSPTSITVDDDDIWTVQLTDTETDDIDDDGELYMQIDAVEDGVRERWGIGNVRVYEDATA